MKQLLLTTSFSLTELVDVFFKVYYASFKQDCRFWNERSNYTRLGKPCTVNRWVL